MIEEATKSTSERILDAAEDLFARQGFRGTSLKEITELAEVNIAAVNYHFRSKDALIRAVYERCFVPLNEKRLRALAHAEQAANGAPLTVEAVLRALFEPMVRAWITDRNFILLVGRLQHEPDSELGGFIQRLYQAMIPRFLAALARALPSVPEGELFFWTHYLFGGVVYTLLNSHDMQRFHEGQNLLDTPDLFLDRLIELGASALRALAPTELENADNHTPGHSVHEVL
ncbi:MAG: TetR/AcrR family transcriptional regulator [Bryobacterales bacterium]|nr:TetR/AcrR family transcriptional regulator [Bryobacterales bacterium]